MTILYILLQMSTVFLIFFKIFFPSKLNRLFAIKGTITRGLRAYDLSPSRECLPITTLNTSSTGSLRWTHRRTELSTGLTRALRSC